MTQPLDHQNDHIHVCSGQHGVCIETFDPPQTSDLEDSSIAAPSVIIPTIHSPYFVGFKFHHNGINATGFVFRITQGDKQLKFQGLRAHNRSTPFFTPGAPAPIGLGITDFNTPINVEVYATSQNSDGTTSRSASIKMENVSIAKRDVKHTTYQMRYDFNMRYGWNVTDIAVPTAPPWTTEEKYALQEKLDRIINYFKIRYGNPMTDVPLTVTKLVDANYAIVLKDGYEMRVGPEVDERLLAHELFHAWWCPVWFTVDEFWNYDPTHSWMEEGLAEWAGRDFAAQSDPTIYSSLWKHNIYDIQNKSYLANNVNFFYLIQGENSVTRSLYGLAATAFSKLIKTNPNNISWMYNYYAWLLNSGEFDRMLSVYTRKEIYMEILTRAFLPNSRIEGEATKDWLESQKIFSGELVKGPRVFERIEFYFNSNYTQNRNLFYLVDIFENGESWVEYGKQVGSELPIKNRYKRNGTGGRLTITDWNGKTIYAENIKIEPEVNPPQTTVRGSINVNLVNTSTDVSTYIQDNYPNYININLEENGLYKIKIEFNIENNQKVTLENYRPVATIDERSNSNGVLIGVPEFKHYKNFRVNGSPVTVENGVIVVNELNSEYLQLTYEHPNGVQYRKERILPYSNKVNIVLFDDLNN